MGTTLVGDPNIRFFDAAPVVGTSLTNDTRIKFVDANFLGHWVQGDAVVYDTNNNGKYDFGEQWIGGRLPTVGQTLTSDSKIKFVDTNLNGFWDIGETVVYEKSAANTYALGDAVIGAIPPTIGVSLTTDSRVKYVDSGNLGHWVLGDAVAYDSNSTGRFSNNTDLHLKYVDTGNLGHWMSGDAVVYDVNLTSTYSTGDKVLSGTVPGVGTQLKFDKLVKFLDPTKKGYWIQGDAIVYDSNNDNIYESGEPIIVNSSPLIGTALSSDPKISYVDSGSLGHWTPGDTVIYDSNSNGFFDASIDPWVMYYNSSGASHWVPGETVVYDTDHNRVYDKFGGDKIINGTSLPDQTPLTFDSKIRIVDPDLNGHWDIGEPVIYDADNGTSDGNIYVSSDTIISAGSPGLLLLGASLTEPVLFGTAPPVGTTVKIDPKMKYVETNGNTIWEFGEAVVYDNNTNNVYDSSDTVVIGSPPIAGSILRDPLIAGAGVPAFGTLLKTDPNIKIAAATGPWNLGAPVVYDSNGNNLYDIGESVIAGGAGPSGVWTQGEGVFYDSDSATNSTLSSTDPVINGTSPLPGTPMRFDAHIKFVDSNSVGHWVAGDTVTYDSNNSNLYVSGDIIILGSPPGPLDVLMPVTALDSRGRIWLTWNEKPYGATRGTQIYYKLWNGTAWTSKQLIVSDPANVVDNGAYPLALPNQTMMIFWISNKTGHTSIFYRSYNASTTNPLPTSNPVQLTSSAYPDKSVAAVADRYGRIWVAWARTNSTLTCVFVCSNIYYKYYNGTSWSSDFLLPPAANPTLSEVTPSISRTNDGRIWIFWSTAIANTASTYNIADATTDGTIQTLPTSGIPPGSWTGNSSLIAEGTDIFQPSMAQSRDGILWVFYQSNDPINPNQYIHYVNSTNLTTWNGPYSLTANANDGSPTAVQMTDHRIWIFWGRTSNLSQIDYTTSGLISNVYHLGIQQIALGARLVRSGWSVWINVTVTNNGDFTETGLLKVTLNSTVIETTNQTFTSGTSYLLNYNWTGRVGFWGRYTLNATLQPAFAESTGNRGDENWSVGLFRVSPPGDVDGNGVVNILDAADLSIVYGQLASNHPYDDIDRDAKPGSLIDILDAATLALYFGVSV